MEKRGRDGKIVGLRGISIRLTKGLIVCSNTKVFAGCDVVTELGSIPSGLIAMWSGAGDSIPNGWLLCDGNNDTPDLRNRFIVGAGNSYSVGATGGSDAVTLSTSQIPSHNHSHSLSVASGGSHTHSVSGNTSSSSSTTTLTGKSAGGANTANAQAGVVYCGGIHANTLWTMNVGGSHTHSFSATSGSGGSHTHTLSGSISNTGGGQSHENRPPYYALCFIMKE